MEQIWIYTCSRWSCKLGGSNCGCVKIEWEAGIERVWRFTWRPWLSKFPDALGGQDWVNSEMLLEIVIEDDGRSTWRPSSIRIGGVLGAHWSGGDWSDGSQSAVSDSKGIESGGSRLGGMNNGSWDSMHWVTHNCSNAENWVQQDTLRAGRLAGSRKESIFRWCSTWCIKYLAYAVLIVYYTQYWLLIMPWRDREEQLNFVFLGNGRVEDEKERWKEMR